MFAIAFYVVSPIPTVISGRYNSANDFSSGVSVCSDVATFLTAVIVVSAYGFPIVLCTVPFGAAIVRALFCFIIDLPSSPIMYFPYHKITAPALYTACADPLGRGDPRGHREHCDLRHHLRLLPALHEPQRGRLDARLVDARHVGWRPTHGTTLVTSLRVAIGKFYLLNSCLHRSVSTPHSFLLTLSFSLPNIITVSLVPIKLIIFNLYICRTDLLCMNIMILYYGYMFVPNSECFSSLQNHCVKNNFTQLLLSLFLCLCFFDRRSSLSSNFHPPGVCWIHYSTHIFHCLSGLSHVYSYIPYTRVLYEYCV